MACPMRAGNRSFRAPPRPNNWMRLKRPRAGIELAFVIARSVGDEAIHLAARKRWIASQSLSSGAHARDPLARNDGLARTFSCGRAVDERDDFLTERAANLRVILTTRGAATPARQSSTVSSPQEYTM